jgi:salicylate hydroxylase
MLIGRTVMVAGAGIAGLAVARALAMRGAKVTVYEQAHALREVGAGIQISPNGARVLHALGLGDALERAGTRAGAVELIDGETGSLVARMPLPQEGGAEAFRFLHRADLLAVLAEGAREAGCEILLGRCVASMRLGAHPPVLYFEDGGEASADLLVGADGLHSSVRAALNGRVAPFFTHQVAWRALVKAETAIPNVARVYLGPGRHLVTYPIRGGSLRNIVAVEERRKWAEESWSLTDDALAMRVAFGKFVPEVQGWLSRIDAPNLWGLFRHPVATVWHRDGAVILGDAAHPTLPFLAQGACMALEDAWVLSDRLGSETDQDAALAAYQAARRPRAMRIVDASTANARNYHLSGLRRDLAHAGLRLVSRFAPGRLTARFDWLYDYDATR